MIRKDNYSHTVYLCVNENGTELIFESKPRRMINHKFIDTNKLQTPNVWYYLESMECEIFENMGIELPYGTIEKLISRKLTWEDEPVLYTDNTNLKTNNYE